jgi:hypothetical protein
VRDSWRWGLRLVALSWFTLVLCGCSTPRPVSDRPFLFKHDTFAYANELIWEYHFDPATGEATHHHRKPPPDYTHHCFAVARSAKQFFLHAKFDASQPVAEEAVYRRLIREVISRSARSASNHKVIVPGFASLYDFSQAHEELLKEECGGAWQSYFQRGHWRMIFPFSRAHQEKLASRLVESLKENCPPVVHVVRFPSLSINHAVVVFEAAESENEIRFGVYDPNVPEHPASLTFDRATRTFHFPANCYFIGGRVDVYEIYCAVNY